MEQPDTITKKVTDAVKDTVADNIDKNTDTDAAGPADFEKAMHAAGFGKFHLFLLLTSIPATCGSIFETTTMSYILPIAECDLQMTLFQKGILNAVTYAGMICSAIIWGYLADTKGRKKILVYGFLFDGVCVLLSGMSQNFVMLATFKFVGGFIVNGPGAVLITYLTELHDSKQRPRVIMMIGIVTSLILLLLPLLAWAIFPRDWHFVLFQRFNVHSWQIFLMVSALPTLVAGSLLSLLPESPKFLMSQGRNAEALIAFQRIYAINTGKPRDTFPIKELIEEVPSRDGNANEVVYTIDDSSKKVRVPKRNRSFLESLRDGMHQVKPMFRKPLLGHALHVYTLQFCVLLGLNTIRLWLPQLFASIADYEREMKGTDQTSNMCAILEYSANTTMNNASNCDERKPVEIALYTNNIIVAIAALGFYLVAGSIIKLIGQKQLLIIGLFISSLCGMSLYWSTSGLTTLIISAIYVSIGGVATSSLLSLAVYLFPTSLRTLIIAIAMMCGRLGALCGNLLFPILMQTGCMQPFLMVGFVMLGAAALSCMLPSPKQTTFT